MNSRQRVQSALAHQQPDRIPLDLGATPVSGMHVQSVYRLRQALGLDAPGTPVRIIEPYQNLGEIKPDLMEVLGVDVVGISPPTTLFGFRNRDWKPWTAFGGTPVEVPGGYNIEPEPDGSILMYPDGDQSIPPSGRMPAGGWYFDSLERQQPVDDDHLNVEDNLEEFSLISEADLKYFRGEVKRLSSTGKAILANFGGTAFGDIALVPAPWLKHPRGIRGVEEWYVSTASRRDYVYQVFERQCQIAMTNLERLHGVVGERIDAIYMTGSDFGTQRGPFISPRAYRSLFQPFHKILNDWVHRNTTWKTFIHSCGSVVVLIPDFIAAGFDILNTVQCSAEGMDAAGLKARFGEQITFWGGGVDTQQLLPFGTPAQVSEQVRRQIEIFGPGGGYVFNTIHNVQPQVPVENLLALYQAVNNYQ